MLEREALAPTTGPRGRWLKRRRRGFLTDFAVVSFQVERIADITSRGFLTDFAVVSYRR